MKHLVISLILSAILLGCTFAQSAHDEVCSRIQKQGVASCFDRSTLGFCMKVADEWKAIEAATCDSRLCCNAKIMGCTMDADCTDEWATSTSTISTTTDEQQQFTGACVVGNLKKHESDCKRYYYCSNKNWVESKCSAGVFDENRRSCVFGSCDTS